MTEPATTESATDETASDATIYALHSRELVRFATAITGPTDAADVVSDAVVNAMSSRSWTSVTDKRAYLYRCVLNTARNSGRSEQRRLARERRVARPDRVDDPLPRPDVFEAVRSLSARQRAATYLTYWEDLTPTSIARLLDISEGSVKRHLARAREQLRRELDA